MLRLYGCVLVLVVMCHTVIGQLDDEERPDEWNPEDMPHPVRNPQHCRLGQKAGFMCDPDGILTERSVELLNWLLRGAYDNDTVCPCSTYWCERTRKGTHISIALINRMKLAETFDDPDTAVMQAASNFALKLQNQFWNFGTCNNDVVIFFSRDDGVLFVSYGQTAALRLNNAVVSYIQGQFGHYFRPGGDIFVGLAEMVVAIRQVLNGNYHYDPNNPNADQLIGGTNHVASGVLATVILALVSRILS
ncbi:uncharacterized protein [Haliotis asinina]|uniref:uncharacterized protein n=1 Tax=Haliotis asinina TaxID=109174 RepID=UPI0035322AB4